MCKSENGIRNLHDQGAKFVFKDPELCAQLLRDYVPIDCLRSVKAEQIEDLSERFVTLWDNERQSDVVKKISLFPDKECYMIAVIEHQSDVDHRMPMKLLRYETAIWTDYEKEMEKKQPGITKTAAFRYPPILPIVYFEGTGAWTAARQFSDRIALSEMFLEYLPDFRYEVIRIQDYTNEEIIDKGNELSLIMLINKLKDSKDLKSLAKLPANYLNHLEQTSPDHLKRVLRDYVTIFMHRLNIPEQEIAEIADRIERRKGSMWFDNFEGYDIQEVRRNSREEGRNEERQNTEQERQRAEQAERKWQKAETQIRKLEEELRKYTQKVIR